MGPALSKLLSIASSPLSHEPGLAKAAFDFGNQINPKLFFELAEMLRNKAGFYVFESALYVRPPSDFGSYIGLSTWNSLSGWRRTYQDMAEGLFFFAEDLFGVQFAIADEGVIIFDPETGGRTFLADSLEAWASTLLSDYQTLTGHPMAHDWQAAHGPLKAEVRLTPKRPFILGGEFAIDNLTPMNSSESMQFRGNLATQIRNLPDGAQIRFNVIE